MPTASAPGKVYLFGEHAVVYGEPAVPVAIDRRATVSVTRRDDGRVRIDAPALAFDGVTVEDGRDAACEPAAGFDVTVESDLPIGAGLGSSAAVTIATIDAATRACGATLEDRELADRGYRVEHDVQGSASRADTFCATVGGAVRVEGDDLRTLDAPALPLVVGYDGGAGDTGALVAGVRSLREDYGFAADAVSAIGDLVQRGEAVLADDDVEELGRLMDVNHGLLSALGVSARSLDAMVWAAREAGALGAKLTGAGGGGCIVALDPTDASATALSMSPECESAFHAELAREGLIRK